MEGNSLSQADRLDLCQPQDSREEALPWKLTRPPAIEAREGEGGYRRVCGMGHIPQIN